LLPVAAWYMTRDRDANGWEFGTENLQRNHA